MYNISIIVPVYNVENYLQNCLNSLSFLLKEDNEMIIVNDGSTDNSLCIAESYAQLHENVKIVTQINSGLSAARNTGLRKANGNYVWFVDSDDYIDETEFFAVYKDVMSENYDVIVFGRVDNYGAMQNNNAVLENKEYNSGIEYFEDSMNNDVYRTNAWDKIFRKSILADNNICFVEGRLYEDMFFCQHVWSKAKKVKQCESYPYIYNLSNGGSITKQVRKKDLDVLWYIDEFGKEFLQNPSGIGFKERELNMLVFNWVNSCLLKKYIPMMKSNEDAKAIVDKVFVNRTFMTAVKYCSRHHVLLRQLFMSWIILMHPRLYCEIIYRIL